MDKNLLEIWVFTRLEKVRDPFRFTRCENAGTEEEDAFWQVLFVFVF